MPATPRTTVTLHIDDLRLLLGRTIPFAATKDSRPILHGIKLEPTAPGRLIAAAADGFILGVQTSPAALEGPLESVVLPLAEAGRWLRMLPKKVRGDQRARLSWSAPGPLRLELITLGQPSKPAVKEQTVRGRVMPAQPAQKATKDRIEQSAECWPIQGSYPNYRVLVPEWDGRDSLGAIAISAGLLERVVKAWNADRTHNAGIMRWHFKNPASPITLSENSYEGYGFVAVVMPMYVELGSPIGTAPHPVKGADGSDVTTLPQVPEYDHPGAIKQHRAIIEQVLPPKPVVKPARKPAAKRAAKPAAKTTRRRAAAR